MWKGLALDGWIDLYKSDLDPQASDVVAGDFLSLPFADHMFDVLVWDPPHISDVGVDSTMGTRYGSAGKDVCDWFAPFLREAHRVVKPGGILLAKLSDGIHSGKYQWILPKFVGEVWLQNNSGWPMLPDDLCVRVRTNHLNSSLWKRTLHLRRGHVYWIVVKMLK